MQNSLDAAGVVLDRLPAVIRQTGFKKSSIYALVRAGQFPAPVSLGPRAVAWVRADVQDWCKGRITQSRKVAA